MLFLCVTFEIDVVGWVAVPMKQHRVVIKPDSKSLFGVTVVGRNEEITCPTATTRKLRRQQTNWEGGFGAAAAAAADLETNRTGDCAGAYRRFTPHTMIDVTNQNCFCGRRL